MTATVFTTGIYRTLFSCRSAIQPMTELYLLIIGTFVTLIWMAAVILFIWEEKSDKKPPE